MLELLAGGRELLEFGPVALSKYGMASIAIIGLDNPFAVVGRMFAVVAAKTTGPVPMTNVVRIHAPILSHLGEKIIRVNLLNRRDGLPKTRAVRIVVCEVSGNAALGLGVSFVCACQGVNGIGFDPG
jgi:hypothetical protein